MAALDMRPGVAEAGQLVMAEMPIFKFVPLAPAAAAYFVQRTIRGRGGREPLITPLDN